MPGEEGWDPSILRFIASNVETIRDRVGALEDRFVHFEHRFVNLDDRFVHLEDRFGSLENRLGNLEDRFGNLEDGFGNLENRLASVENRMEAGFTAVRGDIERVHLRLDTIERMVSARLDHVETEVSRLRSVVYLLVKDRPELLRLLGDMPLS